MNYTMHITNNDSGDIFDVSELVHNVSYSTSLAGQPGKLTFQLEKDPSGELKIELGNKVEFWDNSVEIFLGYVFLMGTDRTQVYQITAYDQTRYLKNHTFYNMVNKSLPDLFKDICNANQIKKYKILGYAKQDTAILPDKFFNDESFFDELEFAMNKRNTMQVEKVVVEKANDKLIYTVKQGDTLADIAIKVNTTVEYLVKLNEIENKDLIYVGQTLYLSEKALKADVAELVDAGAVNYFRYFIRDEFGTLVLNDIENNIKHKVCDDKTMNCKYDESSKILQPLIIGDNSLLTDYKYELDIDKKTYNQLILTKTLDEKGNDGKHKVEYVTSKQDETTVKKWGILTKVANIKEQATEEQIANYINLSLTEGATVNKTLKLEALGYNGINAGDGFVLMLNKLGICQLMYVVSATHNYDADKHTMNLEVCTPSNLVEVL